MVPAVPPSAKPACLWAQEQSSFQDLAASRDPATSLGTLLPGAKNDISKNTIWKACRSEMSNAIVLTTKPICSSFLAPLALIVFLVSVVRAFCQPALVGGLATPVPIAIALEMLRSSLGLVKSENESRRASRKNKDPCHHRPFVPAAPFQRKLSCATEP